MQKTWIMDLFEYFTQFESLEHMRNKYDRKIYVGVKNEIIHFIDSEKLQKNSERKHLTRQQSEYAMKAESDVKLTKNMLFNSKNNCKVRIFSKTTEVEMGIEEPVSHESNRLWNTLVRSFPFFDERERLNAQIVQTARQILDKREVDQKDKEEQIHFKEQITKLQTNMDVLLGKIDKLDSFGNINTRILEKLMDIEKKVSVN